MTEGLKILEFDYTENSPWANDHSMYSKKHADVTAELASRYPGASDAKRHGIAVANMVYGIECAKVGVRPKALDIVLIIIIAIGIFFLIVIGNTSFTYISVFDDNAAN